MIHKGINYDVGTNYVPGPLSRPNWDEDVVRQELLVIRDQLHCDSVNIFGSDVERLIRGAELALELGLRVWIQPRVIEAGADEVLEKLGRVVEAAERLRKDRDGAVGVNVGCELTIFSAGMIPGKNFQRRAALVGFLWWLLPLFNGRLNKLLRRAVEVVKARFQGEVTYGAGTWERVDWAPFDVIGLNYYMDSGNSGGYVAGLQRLARYGKPIVIVEYGCCSYEGAKAAGAAGDDIVDWGKAVPELKREYRRDERVQAERIAELFQIYRTEGVREAFVFEFIETSYPHSPDPRYDLDMASFGVVKACPDGRGGYRWEPKAAFQEIARLHLEK
ncbi:hypothetical protein [Nonomuraea sp. 10N515B]|uniref:hypothetical protein n=1 Tax=Nonomuraea sp. 10N515B TaxID=3457422 RepID=UPI003FCEA891